MPHGKAVDARHSRQTATRTTLGFLAPRWSDVPAPLGVGSAHSRRGTLTPFPSRELFATATWEADVATELGHLPAREGAEAPNRDDRATGP